MLQKKGVTSDRGLQNSGFLNCVSENQYYNRVKSALESDSCSLEL